jgi:biotin carboxylase
MNTTRKTTRQHVRGKRLLILGAGPFQVPAIHKAVESGCYVITLDYLPDNVGHSYSQHYVKCSTTDIAGVLQAARTLKIDGICTFSSDAAIPAVAAVCESLGLPGPSSATAETMATKHRFRDFLRRAGFPCPNFMSGNSFEQIEGDVQGMARPLIFKPADTSGSRGVMRVDDDEVVSAKLAFRRAQDYSRSRIVCVENFVPGIEVGGDAVLVDGRVRFIAITHKHLRGFVVTGHSLPTNISTVDQGRVIQSIESICTALNYCSGPLNFDAIVAPECVTMLEMSARNGGNGISAVIARATGVDVEAATIAFALGVTPGLRVINDGICRGAGSYIFGSLIAGVLSSIITSEELRTHVPEIFDLYILKRQGERVNAFEHNGNLIGYAVFDCKDSADYERIKERIDDALDIRIQAG